MDNVEDALDERITGLTRRFDEQNALIVALSSRVGFLEDELQDMDRRLARAGVRVIVRLETIPEKSIL